MGSKLIKSLNLDIDYDEYADVLYIAFGKPCSAISVETNNGDVIRLDPYTDEVVGITIHDFKKRYLDVSKVNLERSVKKIIPGILKDFKQ